MSSVAPRLTLSGKPVCAWMMPFSCQPPSDVAHRRGWLVEPRQLVAEAEHEAVARVEERVALLVARAPARSDASSPMRDRQHRPRLAADVEARHVVDGVAAACTTRGSSAPRVGRMRRLACSESYHDCATENVGRTSENAGNRRAPGAVWPRREEAAG